MYIFFPINFHIETEAHIQIGGSVFPRPCNDNRQHPHLNLPPIRLRIRLRNQNHHEQRNEHYSANHHRRSPRSLSGLQPVSESHTRLRSPLRPLICRLAHSIVAVPALEDFEEIREAVCGYWPTAVDKNTEVGEG